MKLIVAAAWLVTLFATVTSAEQISDDASIEDVQEWLGQWNLKAAFGDYFQRLQVDGDMLVHDLGAQHINLEDCPHATEAHVSKLFRKLKQQAPVAAVAANTDQAPTRRRLASASGQSGLAIMRDNAQIALGAEGDVTVQRAGDGQMRIGASVDVDGTLNIADRESLTVGNSTYFDATVDTTVIIGPDPIKLKRGIAVSKSFVTSADYQIEFEISPYGEIGNWGSILHFTSTDTNCCDYGDRIPAIFMFKDSTRMIIQADTNDTGSAGFAPVAIPMNQFTHVRLRVVDDSGEIYINGSFAGGFASAQRRPHDNVKAYIGDPWHLPAAAYLRNVFYQRLGMHHAAFYNEYTDNDNEDSLDERLADLTETVDEGLAEVYDTLENTYWDRIMDAVPGTEANWHVFINDEVKAKAGAPMSAEFYTGAEYELTMDIKPFGTVSGWSNLVHFTNTGSNCCKYGERIPAIFMYANSNRLHIRSGSNISGVASSGNTGFDPVLSLPQGEWTTVRLHMVDDAGDIYYNDTYMGSIDAPIRMPHDGVEVWFGDPWHQDPPCYFRDVKYRVVSSYHSAFYDIATSLDYDEIFAQA